jgi:uncharacterized membrane protein
MPSEHWLGLRTQDWAGLAVAVATGAVLVWSMSDGDLATRVLSTVIGAFLGLGVGVIVLRGLTSA